VEHFVRGAKKKGEHELASALGRNRTSTPHFSSLELMYRDEVTTTVYKGFLPSLLPIGGLRKDEGQTKMLKPFSTGGEH